MWGKFALDEILLELLRRHFQFKSFRGRQQAVIEHLLGGGNALLIMPTGGGKSLCFQLPALTFQAPGELTLVLSPLIALMKDQVDQLTARGVDAAYINSSLDRQQREQRYRELAEGRFDLLYVAPERFRKPDFLEAIAQRRIRLLAVDEAHCISQWGHDFRPDYTRVAEFRERLGQPPTLAMTATATAAVQQDIIRQLGLERDDVLIFHEGIDRPNLSLDVEQVWDDDDKLRHILSTLAEHDPATGAGIIYFTLIRTLEAFSEELWKRRIPHRVYHGDLPRDQRRRVQNDFLHEQAGLILATNAFGMGIDREDIRFVLHAESPGSLESYYQEIGRAGRDGRPSRCLLLYDQRDLATQMQFVDWSNPDAAFYANVHRYLLERSDEVRAYGLEWLNKQLQAHGKHDHRLDTALGMLDRHGVIAGAQPPECYEVWRDELPEELMDEQRLQQKKVQDCEKLFALVEYVKTEAPRQAFINAYFGAGA